jgi:cell division protein ZapA (FtsZ GTPase activity inhibitor)
MVRSTAGGVKNPHPRCGSGVESTARFAGGEGVSPRGLVDVSVSDEDGDIDTDADDPEALASRARTLKTQLRVLRMRAESANFEDREAYRRAITEKEAEIARLEERAELAAIDIETDLEWDED